MLAVLTITLHSSAQKKQFQKIQYITLDLANDSLNFSITGNQRRSHPKKFPSFELMSAKPVVFKIKNINPLRYDIFLNDDLVTNFFDGNTANVPNGSTVNGANSVKEIPAINIFTFDAVPEISLEDKLAIKEVKNEIESIKATYYVQLDTFERIDRDLVALPAYYNSFYGAKKISAKDQQQIDNMLQQWQKASSELLKFEKKLNRKVLDLQMMLNASNDKDIAILQSPQDIDRFFQDPELRETIRKSERQIDNLLTNLSTLSKIINIVQKLDLHRKFNPRDIRNIKIITDPTYENDDKHQLIEFLQQFNYMYEKANQIFLDYDSRQEVGFLWTEEKLKIIEFAFDKKNKAIESFILNNSLEVGKLLEQKWTEYSRDRNDILNKPSITRSDLIYIDSLRKNITIVFTYVKNWIADFALLNQSAKLNNKIFKSVHENIATNCKKLLDFLRDLDHLNGSNTTEYTFPIYNNMKNADLIRFKIDKREKLSTAQQTYEYDAWIKGGIKIDFSVGFFASGLIDKQYNNVGYYIPKLDSTIINGNKEYTHSTVANNDSFYITESKDGNFSFCFGGMVNLIPRNGAKWVNIGASLGVAYSTNQRLQALAGISLHFGKTERLILHSGVAFGTIKEIDKAKLTLLEPAASKAPERSLFVRGNMNDFTIPIIERFAVKPFFGLSYNLSKQNSLQAIKSQTGQQKYLGELP
jgi:hypothetical protein